MFFFMIICMINQGDERVDTILIYSYNEYGSVHNPRYLGKGIEFPVRVDNDKNPILRWINWIKSNHERMIYRWIAILFIVEIFLIRWIRSHLE